MVVLARAVVAAALVAAAGFCAFGFLATYEPPGFPALRAAYAVAGALCLVAAGWVAVRGGKG